MLSKFFIHRPKFALVISLAMTLMGMIALKVLPISEYPQISNGNYGEHHVSGCKRGRG